MALQSSDVNANGFNSAVRDLWLSANHMPLFTQRSPIFMKMKQLGQIRKAGFGNIMREPLVVPVITGPQLEGVTNAYADRNPQPMTGYTTAEFPLSEYIIDVSWQDYDDMRAGSDVEMVKWREAHFKNAELRSFNKILDHFWAAPEGALTAGDRSQIASIQTFINGGTTAATDGGASPAAQAEQSEVPFVSTSGATAITKVGNIERSAAGAAYWCPSILGGGSTTSSALTVSVLNDIYEAAFQEGDEPTLIIFPPGLYSKIQNLLTVGGTNGGQVFGESSLAKLGFSAMKFRNAEIVVDRRCPTSGYSSGTSTAKNMNCFCLGLKHIMLRMTASKPKFKEVPTNKPIQEHVGQWALSLTADHLGNVHSRHVNLTA